MDVEKLVDQLQLACGPCDGLYFAFRPGKAAEKVRFSSKGRERISIRLPDTSHVTIHVGGPEQKVALLKLLQMTKDLVLKAQLKKKRMDVTGAVRKKQGKAKPKEAAACASCGAPLPPHAKFCASCGAPAAPEASANCCKQCGAPLPAGAHFCTECGAKV